MLRLPKIKSGPVFALLLTAFIAWALVLPLLLLLHLEKEAAMAGLYALMASFLISLYSAARPRWRFLVPLAVIAGTVASALLWKASAPARLLSFVRSLASGAPLTQAFTLYMDALLPLILLLLCLFARLLMEGDPAFTLPLMVTPILMLWFVGARGNLLAYVPAVLCLPLLYLYISQTPGERALTARPKTMLLRALIICLVLVFIAFSLTPPERKTLPQAERMADELRRRIEDLFFFTASRNMFTLGSQGYQPMGEKGLGGKPDISWQPVLNVKTTERIYLRGTALDTYTGRSWYDSLSNQRFSWLSPRYAGLKAELFNEELPGAERVEKRSASITLLTDMPSTLFVPQRVKELNLGPDMVAYFNASSEVFITRDLNNGDRYTFQYEPYVAGEARTDSLAARLAAAGALPLPELAPEYTSLPKHLEPGGIVAGLAREIIGGEQQPYRQAQLLKHHLKTNYTYSTDVPWAPENQDFAAHFLFDQKSGYCTYFATAMTVLARSVGLPARYVEGFLAQPEGADSVTLTGMNAHAWTEVFIPGMGWVVFDATATEGGAENPGGDQPPPPQPPSPSPTPSESPEPSEEPSPQPEEATPTPPPPGQEDAPSPEPQPEPQGQAQPPREPDRPFPWWMLLVMALMALFIWRVIAENPLKKEARLRDNAGKLNLYWQALLAVYAQRGQGMKPQETPLSYARRLGGSQPSLMPLARAVSAHAYGRETPDTQAVALAREAYAVAFRQLPRHRQGMLMVKRAADGMLAAVKGLPTWLMNRFPRRKRR